MKEFEINPSKDLFFDLKVREMCRTCKRFGKKAMCPPHIESFEYYMNLLPRYKYGKIFYDNFPIDDDAEEVGRKSSLKIYERVMAEKHRLFAEGHYFVIVLGAGSCKFCKTCTFPCNIPDKGLMPIEAAGIDVVKVMGKFGITVSFPVNEYIYRIGAVLYD